MCRLKTGFMPASGVAAMVTLSVLAGCSKEAEGEDGSPATQAPPAPAVVVEDLRAETVPIYREFVARTEPVEEIEIQARVEAILEAMEFEEGKPVTKDQVLYRLDPRTYDANLAEANARLAQAQAELKLAEEQVTVRAAEAALVQAQASHRKAQQDVARLRPLAEKDAVPRQDLDTAVAAEEVASAQVDVQEAALKNATISEEVYKQTAEAMVASAQAAVDLATLDLEYCTITSPIDGLIGRTVVDVGNLVGRGETTTLATVSSIDPMYVTFAISEEEFLVADNERRKRGQAESEIPVNLILADGSTYNESGNFVAAERAVSVETGTLQLVVRFPNPEGRIRPGQFGRVRFLVDKFENAVLVPQRAVMEQQGTKVVFVVGDGDIVALRTIQVLERYENYYVVREGLDPGERVIVEGQLKARPGDPVKPMDEPVSSEPDASEPDASGTEGE